MTKPNPARRFWYLAFSALLVCGMVLSLFCLAGSHPLPFLLVGAVAAVVGAFGRIVCGGEGRT